MKYLFIFLMYISGSVFADGYHHHHIIPIIPFGAGFAGGVEIRHGFVPPPRYYEVPVYREYYLPSPPRYIWCEYYRNYIMEREYCHYQ